MKSKENAASEGNPASPTIGVDFIKNPEIVLHRQHPFDGLAG
jgi:hypothetical protein